jgi:hypothetical protein
MMNIPVIEMDQEKAREAFEIYRSSVRERHNEEDAQIMRGYKALASGQQIFDVDEVMKMAGLDHLARPRLAIIRADAEYAWFVGYEDGSGIFQMRRDQSVYASKCITYISEGTFPAEVKKWRDFAWGSRTSKIRALVPLIPPQYRPKFKLLNYHILFEPEWEEVPPKDPFLCKHLGGSLFAILAAWDLTEVERMVLKGRFN